ncbi:hypothetical protein HFMG08NCA_2466 [Mycoplasmoides gallisepticum NC08_2008.031-4-3P]|uniref:Uncharacterized protein n=1 Tax=Mycoplasmoides gallisepticum WI01_2001.043-13-2P TaxID=1159201 RepID=J3TR36_MYCGL|nr:hypothetical protein [Mycoplasmoides gallisepticum]AFP75925.1 hypothetical protein HFMG94VAA_2583 [Mycoplasmoides gallisepticum VA94_7994-1-7P]AFP76692.1 hypothetical protein HFMG95NCA_2510 [Mycoplasmoides gallisepticum NC95_13295-2-2P]AFP77446.1 hypothetical protein HFMG96NCA_2509 [Mycoplasmoides gallisepticum NC96_1596-4-2P]AFP78217.1 hypothetical protein HFMG01NYA_2524 [Mycoplasmoides gallisepticum NY01_2001.047-5-1P]AFP78977.1 hypothetical protein HFMG01WIA_2458 [Mycoplasmoides gallisep
MARTKKNKSETKTTKKRGRKARIEQELEQPIQDYGPKLLNVKVQSELDQEDDLDFSHKSIVNDENEIFSGEIKTNRSQLKNKYFDTVLDEEDLLQREFDEIKEKSKKRLISKKAKATDQTAQAIKQSINKRFDDFFDETEKSLITNTIYDGDYHENELADQDLIEKAHDFENASVLIDEIINSSLSQEEKKQEEVYDSLAEITNLNEAELTELENLDLNKLDFDSHQEQKPTTDQHVYQAIAIDEATLKHEIYEPDVLLNIEQPIEINQELSIPTEIKQDLDLDRIKVEEVVTDNALINAITSQIKVEVAEITDLAIEVETQIPKINPETIQEEIIDIKVHDLTKDQVIKNKLKPSYQATSEVVDYAVDEKPTDDEIIKVNDTTDKLSVQSNLNDENIRYEVQQEENTKPKEVHVDVDQLNIKLNKELKKLAKPKKPLDQLEEIPAVIKQDKYVKQEVENIPTNDYRIKKPLDQLQQIPAIIKQVNFAKQEVKKLSIKKPLDQLEEIPAVIKQDKYVKQEVENIPTNDHRNFDSLKAPLDQLKKIPVVLNKVDLATPKAKLSQLAELASSTTDKVEKQQVNSVVDLTEVQKLVDQLEELVKQNQQLLEEKEPQTTQSNDQVDLLENLINEFDYELEQLEELNKNFNTNEFDQDSKTTDIIVEDLATTEIEFKPDYQALTSELLDDTIHPIKHYDSGWKPQEIDVKYNYSEFDFNDYHKILDQQTEFKMFCKKAIDYSSAPMIKMADEQSQNQDDLIELDYDETTNSTDQIELTDNVADIEVSDWETIENHPMIDFQSLINKHSEQSKYYLEDKSSTTELVEQLDETDQTQETDFNFEGLDEDITRLIIEQKENIKHRLISQGEYNPENLAKESNQRLKEETRKIVVKNINNEYTNINEINKFKKPLVSVEIKPVHPFATKSLKDRLIASQKIEAKTVSKKVATKSILNDLKGYQFKGANLIFKKSEPKKLTNNK